MTAEQKARDLLERMGVENAQSFSSGELVELANLISVAEDFKRFKERAGLKKIDEDRARKRYPRFSIR